MLKSLKVYYNKAEPRKNNHKFSRIKFSRIRTNYLTRLMNK